MTKELLGLIEERRDGRETE